MEVIDPATGLVWLYDSGIGGMTLQAIDFTTSVTYYYATYDCSDEPYVLMPPPQYPVKLRTGGSSGPIVTRVATAGYVPPASALVARRQFGSPFGCEFVSVNTTAGTQGVWMRQTDINAAPDVTVPTLWFMPPLHPSIVQ
jgi:hypothetical protein